MNFFRNTLSCVRSLSVMKNPTAYFHSTSLHNNIWSPSNFASKSETFLNPIVPLLSHLRGMKYKVNVKKRCEHCYIIWKDGRKFNYCKVRPRHNHATTVPKDIARFIISHRTWGKRQW